MKKPLLKTGRADLYVQSEELSDRTYDYYRKNSSHLSPWEPLRDDGYFEKENICKRLDSANKSFTLGHSVPLAAVDKIHGEIIGFCNFTNIVRGPFLACFLGYSIDCDYEGRGLMFEILSCGIEYMFIEQKLHRIMANYMPRNDRSGKLLKKLGFVEEGLAKSYLKINGSWEDHILTSLIRG